MPSPRTGSTPSPAPAPAAFYCAGSSCFTSSEACGTSGFQLSPDFKTACTPRDDAWCAHDDRTSCTDDERGCASTYQTTCRHFEGAAAPPPPPPHRPAGPPEVLALLATSQLDPTPRALVCHYVDGHLDPAGPAHYCPASAADFRRARADVRIGPESTNDLQLRIVVDEFLGEGFGIRSCTGDACTAALNTGVIEMTCGGERVPITAIYERDGDRTTDPVGPAIVVTPRPTAPYPADSACALIISDWVVDEAGEKVPDDQRRLAFELER